MWENTSFPKLSHTLRTDAFRVCIASNSPYLMSQLASNRGYFSMNSLVVAISDNGSFLGDFSLYCSVNSSTSGSYFSFILDFIICQSGRFSYTNIEININIIIQIKYFFHNIRPFFVLPYFLHAVLMGHSFPQYLLFELPGTSSFFDRENLI